MPLSRLSPRSSQTAPVRQKASAKPRGDAQRHLQLWAAIRKTQEELNLWQAQVDQVDALFNEHIVPRERELTGVVGDVTELLIEHFAADSLGIAEQSLLGLWVTDNLNSLKDHPFGDSQRTQELSQAWLELLNNDGAVENQLARLARQHNLSPGDKQQPDFANTGEYEDEPDGDDDDEPLFDFGMHKKASDTPQANTEKVVEPENVDVDDGDESDADEEPSPASVADTINSLEDKLSVERLFRQLAKVLHPDREQDEQAKAAKHVLMSQCLKARKENDINTLLTLYCEHVGELPDDLNNNSHKELINALQLQLRQLQTELRQKRFGDPLQAMIVERYASSSNADCDRRIRSHAQSLDVEIQSAQRTQEQLGETDGLLDALVDRRAVEQDRMAIDEMTGLS